MARAVCQPFRPFPDRLRHLDQRALVRLRHDLQDLSRLARATAGGAGATRRERQCGTAVRAAADELAAAPDHPGMSGGARVTPPETSISSSLVKEHFGE